MVITIQSAGLVEGWRSLYIMAMRMTCLTGLIALLPAAATAGHAIAPDEAQRAASSGDLTIVDVRLPAEWAATGLPDGAIGVSLQDASTFEVRPGFAADLLARLGGDKDAEIALICARGNRSSFTQELLEAAGFGHVHDVSEGMLGGPDGPGWLARGLPVEPCEGC